MVAGQGLVCLGKWVAGRHDKYICLMKRIHKMIAVVTIAEKNERAKEKVVNKAVLGYDPETWVESSLKVRSGNQDNRTSQYLDTTHPREA